MARRQGTGTYTKTYMTKNGPVTKTYTRGQVNVLTKKGNISKPFMNRVLKQFGDIDLMPAERLDVEATTKRLVKSYQDRGLPTNLLTPERVKASYMGNKIEGMLINTGFSLEEIAAQANTTVDVLLNETNWNFKNGNSLFMNEKREVYFFEFRYNGSVMEKVNVN